LDYTLYWWAMPSDGVMSGLALDADTALAQ
jgi:hypothetical protein